jgi:translation elongation factor EF-1alpha
MSREEVGRVKHYYSKISVAIIELSAPVNTGDRITIVGPKTEFDQEIGSMQVEHQNINAAQSGDLIGLKVIDKVREGDRVFRFARV